MNRTAHTARHQRLSPLPMAVIDVLHHRQSELTNLAEALRVLPYGIAAMIDDKTPGTQARLSGLLHPMTAYLEEIAKELEALGEGRLPGWYID
jgi:hypothetical protein